MAAGYEGPERCPPHGASHFPSATCTVRAASSCLGCAPVQGRPGPAPLAVRCTLSCWGNPHHLCRLSYQQDRLQLSLTHSAGHWPWELGQTRLPQWLCGSQVPGSAVCPCQLGLPMQEVVPSGTGAHRAVSASCIFDVVGQPALVFLRLLSLAHSTSGDFCGSSKHIP